jgi:hypothetical protein
VLIGQGEVRRDLAHLRDTAVVMAGTQILRRLDHCPAFVGGQACKVAGPERLQLLVERPI